MLRIDLNNGLHEYCCSMGSDVERPGRCKNLSRNSMFG